MKHHRIRTTYDRKYTCISCGAVRSDRSEHYCYSCNKKRDRINCTESTGGISRSSDWKFDDLGNPTRLYGDLEHTE